MTDTKLPHMPLWVYDIDTDRDCRRMDDATFGRYMRLLIRQWIEGCVPTNAADAIRDAFLDHDATDAVKALLDRKFKVQDGSVRRNSRCHTERQEAVRKVEVNRENGRRGGRPSNNPPDNRSDNPNENDIKTTGPIRAYGSGCGSGSSSEGGCGGNRNTHNLLERIGGAKKHVPAIGAFVRSSSEAVALWWDVAKTGKAVSVLAVMASRAANQTTPPPITIEAVYEACAQGVVRSVDGHEVAGASHIGKNANGLYFDQKLILPYARLAEDVYA